MNHALHHHAGIIGAPKSPANNSNPQSAPSGTSSQPAASPARSKRVSPEIYASLMNRLAKPKRRMERDPVKAVERMLKRPGVTQVLGLLQGVANGNPVYDPYVVGGEDTARQIRMPENMVNSIMKLPPITVRRAFLMLQRYRVIHRVRIKHGKYTITFEIRWYDLCIYMMYAAQQAVERSATDPSVQRVITNDYSNVTVKPFRFSQIMKMPRSKRSTKSSSASLAHSSSGNSGFTELPESS